MRNGMWVVVLVLAAAALPGVLLLIVRFGQRHVTPHAAALGRWAAHLQQERPITWLAITAALQTPVIGHAVWTGRWAWLLFAAIQLIGPLAHLSGRSGVSDVGIES